MSDLSNLFIYKFIFFMDLIVAEALFLFKLKKKPHFRLRLGGCLVTIGILVALFPILFYNALYCSVMFSFFFVLSILGIKVCFDINWSSCIFCAVAGYSLEHLASVIYDLILTATGFDRTAGVYSSELTQFSWYEILIFIEVYLFVYWTLYHVFGRRIQRNEDVSVQNTSLMFLTVVIASVEIFLNAVVIYQKYEQLNYMYYFSAALTNLLCTFSVLIIQFNLLLQKNLRNELSIVSQMWHQEQKQFQLSKETIDLINLKCHDMKHQIRSLSMKANISPDALEEIDTIVDIYDSIAKTGNLALDVILAEKSLYCKKYGVIISCIADGQRLDFMSDTDIYSLFGNILDNAIQAVIPLEPDMRVIGLTIRAENALLSINSNNYYGGVVYMNEGFPVTQHADRNYHGFGTKSMAMIVEKYSGTIKFEAKNQVFNLNILIPLSAADAASPVGTSSS